ILRPIGGGGMGQVYLAEDLRLPGRRCAVKELSSALLSPQDRSWALPAFQREAHLLASLSHPNLAAVTDFFQEGENWYLVMEFVDGETLAQRLERSPGHRLPLHEALAITRQLCDVLEYLHNRTPPVIFRDLKPSNIMLTREGAVKLIDFGIARFFKPGQRQDTINLGTPGYAAPEQYGGLGQSDPRTDIYSLGVLLHQMVTGYDPTTSSALPFSLPPPRALMPGIPPEVERVILQATQLQPDARYPNVRALRADLLPPTQVIPVQPLPGVSAGASPAVTAGARAVPQGIRLGLAVGLLAVGICAGIVVGTMLLLGSLSPTRQGTGSTIPVPTLTATAAGGTSAGLPLPPSPSPTPFPCAPYRLVYAWGNVGKSDVYVAQGDGTGAHCVACDPVADEAEPEWSPDGQTVIYQSDQAASYDIWTVSADTGIARRLMTTPDLDEREPTWSPDGQWIAYRVNPRGADRNADGELWVIDASGNNARSLGETGRSPAWSPDGSRLAFMSNRTGKWQIYIYDINWGTVSLLTDCAIGCRWPAWSPDSRFVAYHSIVDDLSMTARAIWYIPADGGVPVRVLSERGAGRPSWSSCGWIAFHSSAGIEVMREDGSGRFLLIPGDGWAAVWSK
ncbi:MAG: protein kinase domain-containing protein, partial [Anaerolineae bacterium]